MPFNFFNGQDEVVTSWAFSELKKLKHSSNVNAPKEVKVTLWKELVDFRRWVCLPGVSFLGVLAEVIVIFFFSNKIAGC